MWTTSAISAAGRLTIPQALRDRLRLRQGSKVHMQELADGVVIISTRPLTHAQIAGYLLDSLVTGIGPEAERLGFYDEEDLDVVIRTIRVRTLAERYGITQTA